MSKSRNDVAAGGSKAAARKENRSEKITPELLRMRRHLLLFEDDVLTNFGIVLFELKLPLLKTLVLRCVVGEAGAGARYKADVVAHGTRGLSRASNAGNDLL